MAAIERATQTDFLSTRMPIVRLLAVLSNHPSDGSGTFLEARLQLGEIYREFASVDGLEPKKKIDSRCLPNGGKPVQHLIPPSLPCR